MEEPSHPLEEQVTRLVRELEEARAREAASASVLRIIGRSEFDLQSVLDALAGTAQRVCGADAGTISQRDGNAIRIVAGIGASDEFLAYARDHPLPVDSGSRPNWRGGSGRR